MNPQIFHRSKKTNIEMNFYSSPADEFDIAMQKFDFFRIRDGTFESIQIESIPLE